MALSTVYALGAGLVVTGLVQYAGYTGGLDWIVGGIIALVVGYATKSVK